MSIAELKASRDELRDLAERGKALRLDQDPMAKTVQQQLEKTLMLLDDIIQFLACWLRVAQGSQ